MKRVSRTAPIKSAQAQQKTVRTANSKKRPATTTQRGGGVGERPIGFPLAATDTHTAPRRVPPGARWRWVWYFKKRAKRQRNTSHITTRRKAPRRARPPGGRQRPGRSHSRDAKANAAKTPHTHTPPPPPALSSKANGPSSRMNQPLAQQNQTPQRRPVHPNGPRRPISPRPPTIPHPPAADLPHTKSSHKAPLARCRCVK